MADYRIYGLSKQGVSSMHNCDNIYMNGIYMDSFTFSRYEKDLEGDGDAVLLIICGGRTDNEISKELLSQVKLLCTNFEEEDPGIIIERISGMIKLLDLKYSSDRVPKLDVGILAARGGEIHAVSYGGIGMLMSKGNNCVPVFKGSNTYSVGTGNISKNNIRPVVKKVSGMTRFLIYTQTVSKAVGQTVLNTCMAYPEPRVCVENIETVPQIKNMSEPGSVMCMDLNSEAVTGGGKTANIILALIVAAIIAVVTTMGIMLFGSPDSNSAKSRETIEKLEKEGKLKDEVNNLEEEANAALAVWKEKLSEIATLKENINGMISSGNITAEEAAETLDVFKKLSDKVMELDEINQDANNETDLAKKVEKYTIILSEEGFSGQFNDAKQKYNDLEAYAASKAAQAVRTPSPTASTTTQKQNQNTNTQNKTNTNKSGNTSPSSGKSTSSGTDGGNSSAASSGSGSGNTSSVPASKPVTPPSNAGTSANKTTGSSSGSSSSGSSSAKTGSSGSGSSSSGSKTSGGAGTGGGHNNASKNGTAIE